MSHDNIFNILPLTFIMMYISYEYNSYYYWYKCLFAAIVVLLYIDHNTREYIINLSKNTPIQLKMFLRSCKNIVNVSVYMPLQVVVHIPLGKNIPINFNIIFVYTKNDFDMRFQLEFIIPLIKPHFKNSPIAIPFTIPLSFTYSAKKLINEIQFNKFNMNLNMLSDDLLIEF